MGNNTIKNIIIELRDSGKSFADISDILREEYNIEMTRQAVHSMYKRATSDKTIEKNRIKALTCRDIIEYKGLGLSSREIKEILGYDDMITIADIDRVIFNSEDELEDIKDKYLSKIIGYIKKEVPKNEIYNLIQFKGINMTVCKFEELFKEASIIHIENTLNNEIRKIYSISNDRKLTQNLSQNFGLNKVDLDVKRFIKYSQLSINKRNALEASNDR